MKKIFDKSLTFLSYLGLFYAGYILHLINTAPAMSFVVLLIIPFVIFFVFYFCRKKEVKNTTPLDVAFILIFLLTSQFILPDITHKILHFLGFCPYFC